METKVEEVRQTIDSATDKTLVGLLEQVVATGGGRKASVKGYRIAGKTGTAQKINEYGTGYTEGLYIASFCGFGPVENPKVTLLVVIDEPSGGNFYGGQIAAPVAGRIFSQIFRYMRIEPSGEMYGYDDDELSDDFGAGDSSGSPTVQPVVVPESKPKPEPAPVEQNVDEYNAVVPNFYRKSIREAARLNH